MRGRRRPRLTSCLETGDPGALDPVVRPVLPPAKEDRWARRPGAARRSALGRRVYSRVVLPLPPRRPRRPTPSPRSLRPPTRSVRAGGIVRLRVSLARATRWRTRSRASRSRVAPVRRVPRSVRRRRCRSTEGLDMTVRRTPGRGGRRGRRSVGGEISRRAGGEPRGPREGRSPKKTLAPAPRMASSTVSPGRHHTSSPTGLSRILREKRPAGRWTGERARQPPPGGEVTPAGERRRH